MSAVEVISEIKKLPEVQRKKVFRFVTEQLLLESVPNQPTSQTLIDSKSGKNVKHFSTKKELYADLGL